MSDRLPDGFRVVLDRATTRLDDGAVLLGGSPPRLLRLAPAARTLLAGPGLTVTDARTAGLARSLLDAGVAHPRPVPAAELPAVTVVIPVKDNPGGLARLLDALLGAGPERPVAVVVVDDGSTPPAHVPDGVRLVRHDRSRGPAAARNTGLAMAETDLVAFLDSDVLPRPGWLTTTTAHLADPLVGLVAPRIVSDRAGGSSLARYEAVRSSLDLGAREAAVVPLSRVAYVPSAALLVRRAAVGQRAFDEAMDVAEDVDLCLRLHAQGWRLRYDPAARVAHTHRTRAGAWWRRKAFYGTGAAPLAQRHPGLVPPVALAPWTAGAVALACLGPRGRLAAVGLTGVATVRLSWSLPVRAPLRTAARLAPQGLAGAAVQLASAAWRHWWPVAAAAGLASRRARRLLLVVGVVEGLGDWVAHRGTGTGPGPLAHRVPPPGPLAHLLLKRADDLAYGSGLWLGAWRARSVAALLPRITRSAPGRAPRSRATVRRVTDQPGAEPVAGLAPR